MGTYENISFNAEKALQRFTVCQYGFKGDQKLSGIDGCLIRPFEAELSQHIRRCSFVARMWSSANSNMIEQEPSEIDGWVLMESKYEPKMFDGDQIPEKVVSAMDDNSSAVTNDKEIGDSDRYRL